MNLFNNHLLIRPLPRIPQLKLLNGQVISITDLTTDEKKAYDQAVTIELLADNTKTIYSGEVVMVPEKLNSKLIKAAIHGIDPDPELKSYQAYKDIEFTTPQVKQGDIIYFHYNTAEAVKHQGLVFKGIDLHRDLLPDQDYWMVKYNTNLSIYAFSRKGTTELIPFEYNLLCECIPPEPLSKLLWTPEQENKNSLKAKVIHPGKCSASLEVESGDIITHLKYAGIPLTVGEKEYAIVNMKDVLGIIKTQPL